MKFLCAIAAIAVAACVSLPRNPEKGVEAQINACLPAAITMMRGLQRADVWSEVLVAYWNDGKPRGHAYAVYLYPPGKNQLWAYDRDWGSMRVKAYKHDAMAVASEAQRSRAIYSPLQSAYYLQ